MTAPTLVTETIESWVGEMTAGLLVAEHKVDGAFGTEYHLRLHGGARIVNVHFRDLDPSPAMIYEFWPHGFGSLDRRHRKFMGEIARKVLDGYRNYETEAGTDLHAAMTGPIYRWVQRNRCHGSFDR